MVYADTVFWVALMKEDDWLGDEAERQLNRKDVLETSLLTFVELSLVLGRYDVDKEKTFAEVLEISRNDLDASVIFQALEYEEEGLNTFDAFHPAVAGSNILSSES